MLVFIFWNDQSKGTSETKSRHQREDCAWWSQAHLSLLMEHRDSYNCVMLLSWPLLSQQKTFPSLILAITRLPTVNNAICFLDGGRPEQQALW